MLRDERRQGRHCRGVRFGLRQSVSGCCGSGSVSRYLISNCYPCGTVPTFWCISVTGRVNPQVLSESVGNGRRCRLEEHFALAARQIRCVLSCRLCRRDVVVSSGQAGLQIGDAGRLTGYGALNVGHSGGQGRHCRGVRFGLRQSVSGCCGSGSVSRYLISNCYPCGTVPTFWCISVTGRVNPQVLSESVGNGRRCRLEEHFALAARQIGGVLRSRLCRRDVVVSSGQAGLQPGDRLTLRR